MKPEELQASLETMSETVKALSEKMVALEKTLFVTNFKLGVVSRVLEYFIDEDFERYGEN